MENKELLLVQGIGARMLRRMHSFSSKWRDSLSIPDSSGDIQVVANILIKANWKKGRRERRRNKTPRGEESTGECREWNEKPPPRVTLTEEKAYFEQALIKGPRQRLLNVAVRGESQIGLPRVAVKTLRKERKAERGRFWWVWNWRGKGEGKRVEGRMKNFD